MFAELSTAPGVGMDAKKVQLIIARLSKEARFTWKNKVLDEAGRIVVEEIKSGTPVKDGKLKASIKYMRVPDAVVIYTDDPKAIMVEEGTKASPGRYVPVIQRRLVKGNDPARRKARMKKAGRVVRASRVEDMWWRKSRKEGGAKR
jgi:hypothetical protein